MKTYWHIFCFLRVFSCVLIIYGVRRATGQKCPRGWFGASCNNECHCRGGDDVCGEKGCIDLECEIGWTMPPGCQEKCPDNKYGMNCFFHCHCPVNDKCEHKNGNCPSQRCHQEWHGSGCQQRLARLFHPPTVAVHGCQNATVSWNAWTENIDVGVTNISAYILKMHRQGRQNWQDVAVKNGASPKFIVDIPNLEKNGIYQFRVDILSKNEKTNITGPPGVPTAFVLVPCIESDVIQAMRTKSNGEVMIQLAYKVNCMVSYAVTGIGDCLKMNGTTATQNFADIENVTLKTEPWKRYRVTIEILHPFNIKYVQSIRTAEIVPSGKVSDIQIDKITPDSVIVSWRGLNCTERGGGFVRYDLILTLMLSGRIWVTHTSNEVITLNGLESFSNYSVQVAFVNNAGRGKLSEEVRFQTQESVPDPPKILNIKSSMSTLDIYWESNKASHGLLQQYHVMCSEDDNFDQSISIMNSARKGNSASFSGLKAFTEYYIKVRANTNSGWGPFSSSVKAKTKEGPPSAVKQIEWIHSNMTCLTLSWKAPNEPNGILKNYKITRTNMFSYTEIKQELKPVTVEINVTTKFEMCGLNPATQYEFTIRATTGGGQGDNSEPVTFWTEIMSPVAPPSPTVVKVSHTSIDIALQPVVIYTGPVSWYQIRVEILQTELAATFQERRVRENSVPHETGDLTAVLFPNWIDYSTIFTVGDNKTFGGVLNKPLSNRNAYRIHYVVYSSLNNVSKWNASSTASPVRLLSDRKQEPFSETAIVLIAAAILIFLLFIIFLLIVYFYRNQWNRKRQYISNIEKNLEYSEDEVLEKYWNATYSIHERRFIVVNIPFIPTKDSSPHPSTRPNNSSITPRKVQLTPNKQTKTSSRQKINADKYPVTFRKEYDALNELPKPKYTFNEATKTENANLNRFSHLLPYDHSRIRLKPDLSSRSTYINASVISKPDSKDSTDASNRHDITHHNYIAAQSPFNPETMRDFWRMIYQQQVRVVVMLTKNVEEKIMKCSKYFPEIVGQSFTFEQFVMRVVNVDNYVDFNITEILLKLTGGNQMSLYVFRLFEWPDKRTVGYTLPLLDMQRKVRQFSRKYPQHPVLVHCGTGNGRTGTFIAIDSLLDEYKQHGSISVFNRVKYIRECRPHMVRTFPQYLFIYDAIGEAFQAGDLSCLTLSDLDAKCKQLDTTNWKTSRTFLEDQFELLCFLTPRPHIDQIRTGLLPENSRKHRYPDIIPPDQFRPPLTNSFCKTSNVCIPVYINAVFIDGYKRKGGYIVTQTPLANSLEEFWCLIYEYGVRTIVMMDRNIKGDTCISYWKHGRSFKYLTVTPESKSTNNSAIVHRLLLKRNDADSEDAAREVHLFRFKCWKNPNFVPVGRDSMLDLIVDVNQWQKRNGHWPIVVHCKDGATNSGLYCTSDRLIQEMTHEMVTDVYHTVKKMKIRRPEMISSVEQYKFCHSVIQLYVSRYKL